MKIACIPGQLLKAPLVAWVAFTSNRPYWSIGRHHGFGGFLIALVAIFLIFLCIRGLTGDNKEQ